MKIKLAFLVTCLAAGVGAESIDITVREAPYVISTVSTKSEIAWCPCRYCGSRTSYEKKSKWDVYNHVWIETTKAKDIPDVCRKCKKKLEDQAKHDRKERDLDRKIDHEESRIRIKKKKNKLEDLRREAR